MNKLHTTIPPDITHFLSWNLPLWDNVSNAVKDETLGYPRYQLHPIVQRLNDVLRDKYAKDSEKCLVFSSYSVAKRVREYIKFQNPRLKIRILQLSTSDPINDEERTWKQVCKVAVVFINEKHYSFLFEYWKLTGEIISSRVAEYVLHELFIIEKSTKTKTKNINNLNDNLSGEINNTDNDNNTSNNNTIEYIETRFGRSLNFMLADKAKKLIKKRIATKMVNSNNRSLRRRNRGNDPAEDFSYNDNNEYDDDYSDDILNMDLMNLHNFNDTNSDISDFENECNETNLIHATTYSTNNINNNTNTNTHSITNLTIDNSFNSLNTQNNNNSNNIIQSLVPAETLTQDEENLLSSNNSELSLTSSHFQNSSNNNNNNNGNSINFNKDVYLFPSGMASIHFAHSILLYLDNERNQRLRMPSSLHLSMSSSQQIPLRKKTVILGTCIPDTFNLLTKFNDFHFIQSNGSKGLDILKNILHSGEQILTVFVETPNLMNNFEMTNLIDLKRLSELFGFSIIIDQSNGAFININGLKYCDMIVSSLGKLFSNFDITNNEEDHEVMAGSLIVNPRGKMYNEIQSFIKNEYEDLLWCEDAIHLEQNSRDVINKNNRINKTTLTLLDEVLIPNKNLFKKIYHPSLLEADKEIYDLVRYKKHGGYGGIILLTFNQIDEAKKFYEKIKLYKGVGLTANLTLIWPYYLGMDTKRYEVEYSCEFDKTMLRISVGLEDPKKLIEIFRDVIKEITN